MSLGYVGFEHFRDHEGLLSLRGCVFGLCTWTITLNGRSDGLRVEVVVVGLRFWMVVMKRITPSSLRKRNLVSKSALLTTIQQI